MSKKKQSINVQNTYVSLYSHKQGDYLSLTDIAKYRNQTEPFSVINNWMRTRAAIEFLALWEVLNNKHFKPIEFERFRNEAGSNYFVLNASEADLLNVALFGITAKQWRDKNPGKKGNIRDEAKLE